MKTKNVLWLGALALCSAAAFAGLKSSVPVTVTVNADASGTAAGNFTTARFSANDVEMIGCGYRVLATPTGPSRFGFCQARTAAGVNGFCNLDSTTLPEIYAVVSGISDYSYVSFSWNAAGICTRVQVSTQSFYIP